MEIHSIQNDSGKIVGANAIRITKEEIFKHCENEFNKKYPNNKIKEISFDVPFTCGGVVIEFTPPMSVNISLKTNEDDMKTI